jgi:hypothetical protein
VDFIGFLSRKIWIRPKSIHLALPFLIMAVLFWLSSLPGTPSVDEPATYAIFRWISPSWQNALHVPAYASLGFAWWWALRAWPLKPIEQVIFALLVAAAYGVFDEWHQSFVPGRYSSLTDVMLDVIGILLGLMLAIWINKF